jgi:L-aspartate oxidase
MEVSDLPSQIDVLIVGSGAAGLYASLCLPSIYQIGLISKESLNCSSSDWAQGGIAAPIALNDSPALHAQDTINAGQGICEPTSVEFLVNNAASCIDSLVDMGVPFDRDNHELAMTLEAAHSQPRILHSQDITGQAIIEVLSTKALARSNIHIYEQATALNLWIEPQTGRCKGLVLLYQGEINWIESRIVILSTGGCGQVFSKTTNPSVSTGDGAAIAWRAGAILRDLEFIQFHPTVLDKIGAPNFLISEAVRGEGGQLVDESGKRFIFDYHSSGELAPRDVVSRAIFDHLRTENQSTYLNLQSIPAEKIRKRFPNIIEKCHQWGIDVFQEPIPVSPAVHYWMGGITVNLNNATSISGLYALGEVASTGIHGANRLASNSLLECLVFAQQFTKLSITDFKTSTHKKKESIINDQNWSSEMEYFIQIREDLPKLMWHGAGISRSHNDLEKALEQIKIWKELVNKLKITQFISNLISFVTIKFTDNQAQINLKLATEVLNLLDVAHIILLCAIFRTESRGGHYRSDYPCSDSNWQLHTCLQNQTCWKSSII